MLYCTRTKLGDILFFTERGKSTLDVRRIVMEQALSRLRLTEFALEEPVHVRELAALKLTAAYSMLPEAQRHGYALTLVFGGSKGTHVRKVDMDDIKVSGAKEDAHARALRKARRRVTWARACTASALEAQAVAEAELAILEKPAPLPIEDDIF